MRRLELQLDPSPEIPRRIRQGVLKWSEAFSLNDTTIKDLSLIVSELVTNAVVHARSEGRIVVTHEDSRLRIEVHDYETAAPTMRPAPDGDGGFGLHVVAATSAEWGWNPTPTGKMVWAEMRL